MPIELKIPEVGESITEVQISQWLKAEGDEIKADESVAVIDSEKTTFDLPAPRGGRVVKILHQAGETVRVGEVVAQIEPEGEAAKEKPPEAKETAKTAPEAKPADKSSAQAAKEPPAEKPAGKEKPTSKPAPTSAKVEPRESSEPKKEEAGKSTEKAPAPEPKPEEKVEGDSKGAKTKAASKPSILPKPAETKSSGGREAEVVPMTMLRRTVASRLVEAKQQMAMLTTFGEVDMSSVQAMRHEHQDAFQKRYQTKLGLMSFFVKATIDALKQFPQLNAEVRGTDIAYHNYFDVGVAIATERGLVVPVLRNAERLSFAEVEQAIGTFGQRAKDGKLKPDELAGGTFTITNGGVFGSLLSTPIINPPQTAILGLHAIQDRPIAWQGQVVIRPMMYVALTYDHRIVDGREAVLFLRRIKEVIEAPARMLVEI